MAKYDPLKDHLLRDGRATLTMTLDHIEALVGQLPPSASVRPEWWANEDDRNTRHVQCKAWRAAGYSAKADLSAQSVTFRRIE